MPGMRHDDDRSPPCRPRPVSIVSSSKLGKRAEYSGSSSLCETVTTGKCLIGLICGSISRLTQKRIT